MRHSPYSSTLFFDSDVICLRDPAPLFDQLHESNFCVFGRKHDRTTIGIIKQNGIPVADLMEHLQIDSYIHCFLCAFVFKRSAGKELGSQLESRVSQTAEAMEEFADRLYDEVLFGIIGPDLSGLRFFATDPPPYQKQEFSFQWNDDPMFIHSAPMRYRELAKTVSLVFKNRLRMKAKPARFRFWLCELLHRRSDQGRSRRTYRFVRPLANSYPE